MQIRKARYTRDGQLFVRRITWGVTLWRSSRIGPWGQDQGSRLRCCTTPGLQPHFRFFTTGRIGAQTQLKRRQANLRNPRGLLLFSIDSISRRHGASVLVPHLPYRSSPSVSSAQPTPSPSPRGPRNANCHPHRPQAGRHLTRCCSHGRRRWPSRLDRRQASHEGKRTRRPEHWSEQSRRAPRQAKPANWPPVLSHQNAHVASTDC